MESSSSGRFIHQAPHRAVTPCRENWLESHEWHSVPESLRLFRMINGTRVHPSIPFFIRPYTSRSLFGWHDNRQCHAPCSGDISTGAMPIPQKLSRPHFISLSLSLSVSLSHSQIYWSGIRITEAKRSLSRGWRQWKKTPGGKNTACRRGAERKWKKYKEREEAPRLFLPHPLSAFTRLKWREWVPSQVTLTWTTDAHTRILFWTDRRTIRLMTWGRLKSHSNQLV